MDNVIGLQIANDAEQAESVLEDAKGQFQDVLILGWNKEGNMQIMSSDAFLGAKERFYILEAAKHAALRDAFQGGHGG
jgi:hypothetical protein